MARALIDNLKIGDMRNMIFSRKYERGRTVPSGADVTEFRKIHLRAEIGQIRRLFTVRYIPGLGPPRKD